MPFRAAPLNRPLGSLLLGAVLISPTIRKSIALDPPLYGVDLACEPQADPPALTLTWPQNDAARQYLIRRRSDPSLPWSAPIIQLPASATSFTDTSVELGKPCEYEVEMQLNALGYEGQYISAYSYLSAGVEIPAADFPGAVLLLVDSSLSAPLQPSLLLFAQDLLGAGWNTFRRDLPRDTPVPDIKAAIQAQLSSTPDLRSVILIGHIPVPYSGNIAPDMHESHRGAWPADLYYAVPNGAWTDTTVSVTSFDSPSNDNFPGDGKFDQSEIPGPVQLELGRIDFAGLPAFLPRTETHLLQTYFEKNHAFRHRLFTAARRGLLHDNFGDVEGDAPAVDAWRHYSQFFGHNSLQTIPPGQFLPALNQQSYLWAYGAGGGSFSKADGVADTPGFAANNPQAVFYILHGSYFGDWNTQDNLLRAALATPSHSLASIWSGLPHWYLHHLGLGATLGYSAKITQNNRGDYKSYRNFFRDQVHIALLGDPTLTLFPVIPTPSLNATVAENRVLLTWSPSPDSPIIGYKICHSLNPSGPYTALASSPASATTFTHATTPGAHFYQIRAVKLERTGSGSYHNLSQALFTSAIVGASAVIPTLSITTTNNAVLLKIIGPSSKPFHILSSTNGTAWTIAGAGTSEHTGKAQFLDTTEPTHSRFYRVAW